MPTYEYECAVCSHRFEVFQRITAEPLRECPKCNGAVQRLPGTGVGIIFKGSGFYATDHRSSDYKKRQKEDAGTTAKVCDKLNSSKECANCPSSGLNDK